jgi:hypothetical protein
MEISQSVSDEKRRQPRQRTYLGARVFQDDGLSLACVIRNLSATGALVEVPPMTTVPDSWVLIDMKNATAYRVTVSWRQGARLGVQFERSYDLQDEVPAPLRHAQRLWASQRALRGDTNLSD